MHQPLNEIVYFENMTGRKLLTKNKAEQCNAPLRPHQMVVSIILSKQARILYFNHLSVCKLESFCLHDY